ncbi:hypothetical protein CEXT_321621 [Caerostris extrusa]|uniref:Uncharacterized protein n=1 Tax=Caerostris extrusa TaxID=172846 RepID=A0AAV4MER3_CAEEX|nr:hypothetical protein CEXT_321621 [Caerostris extrusa]
MILIVVHYAGLSLITLYPTSCKTNFELMFPEMTCTICIPSLQNGIYFYKFMVTNFKINKIQFRQWSSGAAFSSKASSWQAAPSDSQTLFAGWNVDTGRGQEDVAGRSQGSLKSSTWERTCTLDTSQQKEKGK